MNWIREKQYCAVLAILVAGALLTACDRLSNPEDAPGGSRIVVLNFADNGVFQKQYEALIEEFQALHEDIRVHFTPIDTQAGHQHLASLADVVVLPGHPAGAEIYSYRDLEPLQESDASFDPGAFWPGSLEGCRVEGRVIGLPVAVQTLLVFYDGAAFYATGLPRPAPGWSWGDFESAARLLSGPAGEGTTRYGFVGQPLALLGPVVDAGLTQPGREFDPGGLAQALDWYVSLAHAGAISTFSQEDGASRTANPIADGQAAMWIGSPASLAEWRQALSPAVGAAPYPVAADGSLTQTTPAWAKCAGISAGTAHPQEAWTWLQFLTTRSELAWEPLIPPARPAVAEASGYWEKLDAETATAVRYALDHAWYGSTSSEPFGFVRVALERAMAGDAPLAEALASLRVDTTAPPPPTPETAPVAVATPEPAANPLTPPDDARVVRYFANSYSHTSFGTLQALADAFMQAHPDIFVQLFDNERAFGLEWFNIEKVAQQFDCFTYNSGGVSGDTPELLYSLDPLIEADPAGNELTGDLPPDLTAIYRVDGELYGLPVSGQPTVLYYNKDLLSEMSLQPPGLEWTLHDFWTLAEAATTEDNYGFVPLDGREFLNFLLADQGIQLYDLTTVPPAVIFTEARVLNIVSMLVELAENGVIPPINESMDWSKGNAGYRAGLVEQGRAALWMNPAGMDYEFYIVPGSPSFEVGVAPLPLSRAPSAPIAWGASLYISRQAEEPAACWEWIKYVSARPEAFQGVPLRRSALESAQLESLIGRELAAVYRAVMAQPHQELRQEYEEELYPSYPLYVWWPEALAAAFKGAPPEQALAELQAQAVVYLDCVTVQGDPHDVEAWTACAQLADPGFDLPRDR